MAYLAELSAAWAHFLICPTATGTRRRWTGRSPRHPTPWQYPGQCQNTPGPPCLPGLFSPLISARSPNLKLKGKETVNAIPTSPPHPGKSIVSLTLCSQMRTPWLVHLLDSPYKRNAQTIHVQDRKSPINSGTDCLAVQRKGIPSFNRRGENRKD